MNQENLSHDDSVIILPKKTIILLDDQSLILSVHEAILNSMADCFDLSVVTFKSRKEAFIFLSGNLVDLIVLDHMMNGIASDDFIDEIKQSSHSRHVPILIVTANKNNEEHDRLIAKGVSHCLIKPVASVKLIESAKQLININN